jgi:hypothetical protein
MSSDGMIRVNVYESDPLVTFVEPLDPADTWTDYYELPQELVHAAVKAEREHLDAAQAVKDYIAAHRLRKVEVYGG